MFYLYSINSIMKHNLLFGDNYFRWKSQFVQFLLGVSTQANIITSCAFFFFKHIILQDFIILMSFSLVMTRVCSHLHNFQYLFSFQRCIHYCHRRNLAIRRNLGEVVVPNLKERIADTVSVPSVCNIPGSILYIV